MPHHLHTKMWKNIITSIVQASRAASRTSRQTQILQNHTQHAQTQLQTRRTFRSMPALQTTRAQKKAEMDRKILDPERADTVKSGTDAEVAASRSSYDPSRTSPDSERQEAGEESRRHGDISNPLEVSGANKDISRGWDPMDGEARDVPKQPSRRGVTRKSSVVNFWRKQ